MSLLLLDSGKEDAGGPIRNAILAALAFCRGRMRFGPGRLPVPDGTID